MQILTFGNCCKKSKQNHLNAVEAAKNCGITEEVVNVSDMSEMMKYGIMSNPAIVIASKPVSTGRMFSVEQIEKMINHRM